MLFLGFFCTQYFFLKNFEKAKKKKFYSKFINYKKIVKNQCFLFYFAQFFLVFFFWWKLQILSLQLHNLSLHNLHALWINCWVENCLSDNRWKTTCPRTRRSYFWFCSEILKITRLALGLTHITHCWSFIERDRESTFNKLFLLY